METFTQAFQFALFTEQYVRNVIDQITGIDLILEAAAQGLVHQRLISPRRLRLLLKSIEENLPAQFELYIPPRQYQLYYTQPMVTTMTTSTGFAFLLRIPLRSPKDSFVLYRARPLVTGLKNSTLSAYVYEIPDYFATNVDTTRFIELDSSDLLTCSTNGAMRVCPVNVPIRHWQTATCLSSLFKGDSNEVQQLCRRRITQHPLSSAYRIPHTTSWVVALSHPQSITLNCLKENRAKQTKILNGHFVINVPPHCEATGENFILPVHFQTLTFAPVNWSSFETEDFSTVVSDLFSPSHLAFLTQTPPEVSEIENHEPVISSQHKTFLTAIEKMGKRDIDFDQIRAELESTDARVLQSEDEFLLHATKQSTWGTIFLSVLFLASCAGTLCVAYRYCGTGLNALLNLQFWMSRGRREHRERRRLGSRDNPDENRELNETPA